ncbi:bifunctional phosphopantothenoylcysteine decarboxylase/phosphopantothenate--cysteine ligase CoaBC [Aquirufa sp. ROCK-SH2]
MLKGKKIIIGISASIAAYKAILLVRLLKKEGAEVRVIMTSAAKDFVSPLVLSTLSENPVWIDFHKENKWNNHVELGLWADLMVIAPATANTLSKLANGLCDNLLIATYLSARCPIMIAPAMDEDMFKHPSSHLNIEKLISYGNQIVQPGNGFLASGLIGEGRLAEPEEILQAVIAQIGRSEEFRGKKIVINAGPTQEAIDPVRYISNHSTGKMGIALAEAGFLKGAEVELVLGPTHLLPKFPAIKVHHVVSAAEMFAKMQEIFPDCDLFIASAAVADYRAKDISNDKIKKNKANWSIELEKNIDILAHLSSQKTHQIVIGFALETQNETNYALEKLNAKNLDAIVLNSMNDQGAGFGTDTNQVKMFFKDGTISEMGLTSKSEIAKQILEEIQVNFF